MNKTIKIKFDVNYLGPQESTPKYRIFLDKDLMTERTVYWDHRKTFVKENILVLLDKGLHEIMIQPLFLKDNYIVDNKSSGVFIIENFHIQDSDTVIEKTAVTKTHRFEFEIN